MPTYRASESDPKAAAIAPSEALLRGRAHYQRRQWKDAFEALTLADLSTPLGAEDLDRLAWSAGLSAHDDAMLTANERVYHARLEAGQSLMAARAAFWLGFRLVARGEPARASGWLGRAERLVQQHPQDCVEQGYLMLPAGQRHLNAGEAAEAQQCAVRAVEIGERFGERDLIAFALNLQARGLLLEGRIGDGLAIMDQAMVAAASDELSPVVTGIVYCTAIVSCHRVFALERVREWTAALSSWCEANPQLGLFTARCLVHRAEVMEMNGSWSEAVQEARRAVERCVRAIERDAAGRAHYQQAEIHRLRGEFELAEAAYRDASRCGFEPQPGLALLRLAQSELDAAASASRRVVLATHDRMGRTRFLPAHVEIMLAVGDLEEARAASRELQETAECLNTDVLAAIAGHAAGSVHLAEGNPHAVLGPVRRAFEIWQRFGAPYLAARLRVLLARACIALEDPEGALLELDCASEVFQQLGAKPDLACVEGLRLSLGRKKGADHGLTEREMQVLRLIASGKTNKTVARELSLSEKTVDRHVSNIFVKIQVSTRAAATAFAYERKLI